MTSWTIWSSRCSNLWPRLWPSAQTHWWIWHLCMHQKALLPGQHHPAKGWGVEGTCTAAVLHEVRHGDVCHGNHHACIIWPHNYLCNTVLLKSDKTFWVKVHSRAIWLWHCWHIADHTDGNWIRAVLDSWQRWHKCKQGALLLSKQLCFGYVHACRLDINCSNLWSYYIQLEGSTLMMHIHMHICYKASSASDAWVKNPGAWHLLRWINRQFSQPTTHSYSKKQSLAALSPHRATQWFADQLTDFVDAT